jgi:flagellin
MASNVTLSAGVRQNLLSLQNTASLMATTQNRLATGKKVNSALDNPTNFFTSSSLQGRAGDFNALLDSMSNGIKTLEAADNGIKSITKTVESMQSTLRQARQDKSFKTESYTLDATAVGTTTMKNITFSGGAVGATPVNVALATGTGQPMLTAGSAFTALDMTTGDETYGFQISVDGGAAVTVGLATADNTGGSTTLTLAEVIAGINADLAAATSDVRVRDSLTTPGNLEFFINSGTHVGSTSSIAVGTFTSGGTTPSATTQFGFGTSATASGSNTVKTVDQLVTDINAHASLKDKVRASNDNGKLRLENLSLTDLSVVGIAASDGEIDGSTGASSTKTIGGNEVRKNLVKQYNDLRDQLDKLADDASFNGINLLRGDKLKLTFNETGTSTIDIQAKNSAGVATSVNSTTLGITNALNADFDTDTGIDAKLSSLSTSLGTLRSHSSAFGSNLFVVQNRTDFTKAMINTLQTGADALVLADTNEEAANMLALQTRQQLSSTALSLASQADQAVLRLF